MLIFINVNRKWHPDPDMQLWKHLCCFLFEKYGKHKAGYHFISSHFCSPSCCPSTLALLDFLAVYTQLILRVYWNPHTKSAWEGQCWWRLLGVQLFHWPLHSVVMMMDSLAQGHGLVTLNDLSGTEWGWASSFVLGDILFTHSDSRRGSESHITFLNLQLYLVETQI